VGLFILSHKVKIIDIIYMLNWGHFRLNAEYTQQR